ncbi:MAG: TnsA endonuclease N-terminal domain-containing protein [Acidiferrobacterales bacterium]
MKSVRGKYQSKKTGKLERYDSSYELIRFQSLDASTEVKTWTRSHRIRITYLRTKKRHRYSPDILVEMTDGAIYLEEVKGHVFDKTAFALKNRAAELYCKFRGWKFRIVWRDDLTKI